MPNGFGLSIFSDAEKEYAKFRKKAEEFPAGIDRAVGNNAKIVLKESIVQIDELIYSQEPTPGYDRTKNLRRSNKIEQLGPMTWLVYNDAEYAGYVHDGTSALAARPWMQNAIDMKQDVMRANIQEAGIEILGGGEVRVDEVPNTDG